MCIFCVCRSRVALTIALEVSEAIKQLRTQREKMYSLVKSSSMLREQWQVNMDRWTSGGTINFTENSKVLLGNACQHVTPRQCSQSLSHVPEKGILSMRDTQTIHLTSPLMPYGSPWDCAWVSAIGSRRETRQQIKCCVGAHQTLKTVKIQTITKHQEKKNQEVLSTIVL